MIVDSDFFAERRTIEAMATLRRADPLVIFAGAGVPASVDVPPWNQLLRELLIDVVAARDPLLTEPSQREMYVDALIATHPAPFLGSLVREYLPDPKAFARRLHHHLYSPLQDEYRTPVGVNFPRALCELVLSRAEQGQTTVLVTTNFDDVVEHTFRNDAVVKRANKPGLTLRARYGNRLPMGDRVLPVHHIHGYVPRAGAIPARQTLVFSERDFHEPWNDQWPHELLLDHAASQWLLVGMSFEDPRVPFYLSQRHGLATGGPPPIALFSLQGRRWRNIADRMVVESLVAAETSRMREFGVSDVLVTRYYFQDAQFLRDLSLSDGGPEQNYCRRRNQWFEGLRTSYLERAGDEMLERSRAISTTLLELRHLMERNVHDRDRLTDEKIKVELYARDTDHRALFLIASSESVLLDPSRSNRFELTSNEDRMSAAVHAFTTGTPGFVKKLKRHEHGRWNGFWATPIMLAAPPWYWLPVGALVVCTTYDIKRTSLRFTIPEVEKELHLAIQDCGTFLDPGEVLTDALLTAAVRARRGKLKLKSK